MGGYNNVPAVTGASGYKSVGYSLVSIKNKPTDKVRIGQSTSAHRVDILTTWNQLKELASTHNAGHIDIANNNFLYSPWYQRGNFYNLFAVSGKFDNPTGDLRFVFCPDDPESWLIGSGIEAGSKNIYFPEMERSIIKKHFLYRLIEKGGGGGSCGCENEGSEGYDDWLSGSGITGNLHIMLGINNDEQVTITGISGNHFLLKDPVSQAHPLATRMVSTNTLHPPPTGETGYHKHFQVHVTGNGNGDNRFYIAGSGITGGCYLGGTFTGSGYTFFETPVLDVYRGYKYFFNQHHETNHDHIIMFSYTSGGHREGGDAITGKYEVEQAGSTYCFNNYCHYHCPDEQTLMIPIETGSGNKIFYYSSGEDGVGGTGYLNVLTSGDGGN